MAGKDGVYDGIGQFEVICGGCYIPWLTDYVASNGNLRSIGFFFLGGGLAHYPCISYFLSSVCGYILVYGNLEFLCSW